MWDDSSKGSKTRDTNFAIVGALTGNPRYRPSPITATPAEHATLMTACSKRKEVEYVPVSMLVSTVIRTMRSMTLFAERVLERERRSFSESK